MTYKLQRLAAGSYDLVLDGTIIGSVVRYVSPGGYRKHWSAELFDDLAQEIIPPPFDAVEHTFPSLEAIVAWLGGADVVDASTGYDNG